MNNSNSPTHLYTTHNANNTAVFLTGFGRFANVETNPTDKLVKSLTPEDCTKFGIQYKEVLDVSCKTVDEWVLKIKAEADKVSESTPVWFVHLGVGPNKVYYLEQSAYNNKDIWCADNEGYTCQNQQICPVLGLDHPLKCKIDLSSVCKDLQQSHKMQVSQNPGRYLCNYIYFKSLKDLAANNPRINSIFIHFPPEEVSPHSQNKEFLLNFISWLHKSTVCNQEGCKLSPQ